MLVLAHSTLYHLQGSNPFVQSEPDKRELCDVELDPLGRGHLGNIGSKDLSRCFDALVFRFKPRGSFLMSTDTNPVPLLINF